MNKHTYTICIYLQLCFIYPYDVYTYTYEVPEVGTTVVGAAVFGAAVVDVPVFGRSVVRKEVGDPEFICTYIQYNKCIYIYINNMARQ